MNDEEMSKTMGKVFRRAPNVGLVLPEGWHGRPDDNFYTLQSVRCDEHGLILDLAFQQQMIFAGRPEVSVERSLGDVHVPDGRCVLTFRDVERFELKNHDGAVKDVEYEHPEFIKLVRM